MDGRKGENCVSDLKQYELRLKQMSDDQLREEFVEVRTKYNPLRTELALRQIALRDRKSKTLRHLIGAQRMRAAVARLKDERREDRSFYLRSDTTYSNGDEQ
jgi:ribosomal protein L29